MEDLAQDSHALAFREPLIIEVLGVSRDTIRGGGQVGLLDQECSVSRGVLREFSTGSLLAHEAVESIPLFKPLSCRRSDGQMPGVRAQLHDLLRIELCVEISDGTLSISSSFSSSSFYIENKYIQGKARPLFATGR
jgi:hypothetical protein